MVSRRSSGVSSYFSAYSQAPKITDTGVRSSWEASAANCSSAWKERSSRSSIWLKVPASRENSSSRWDTGMRADKSLPWLMAEAVAAIWSKGRKARRAMR